MLAFIRKIGFSLAVTFQVKPYYTLIYERVCLDVSEGIVKESSQGKIRHMMNACIVLHGYIFVLIRIDVNS
jgi:hypothetical protein